MSPRVAIDTMGGDHGPEAVIDGTALAVKNNPNLIPILVGDETVITPLLAKHDVLKGVRVVHTPDAVTSDEKPSIALRSGKNSSMRLAINLVKDGEADATVSGGNTGALMAMALIVLRPIDGIDRPALAAYLPTLQGQCCMLDLGANIDCTSDNLVQFALMGSAFCRVTSSVKNPSIGLLNVGEEEQKGNAAIRDASAVLMNPENKLNYYGFIEGNDITAGAVDVVVSDGFSGNIAVKTAEGTATFISTLMRNSFKSSILARIGYLLARFALKTLRRKLDPQRYNGAVLLGLNGIVVKSHGSARPSGVENAIGIAINMITNEFMTDLKKTVRRSIKAVDKAENALEMGK